MTGVSAHERAGDVFLLAIDLPAEEREEFVRQACAGDAALLEAVRRLLAHDGARLLDRTALGRSVSGLLAEAEAHANTLPERIGRYRVLERLGAGSTGIVYRVEQETPRRELAVKLLRSMNFDERLVRRLGFEAEVLARLDHVGIAHVYEAGWHDGPTGGVPYLAMELVRGRPLDEWVEQRAPALPERVALLAEICDAVSHAHGRGVIHRDLKPENILVNEIGQAKVLDFGIARVARDDDSVTTLVTRAGQVVGTLPYMSPEQVGAHPEALDTRADVYALGVLAYRVLSGRAPYEVTGLSLHEASRVIREELPTPLGKLDARLRGDIEIVVAHALEKEPDRRYDSAANLAADLRRTLSGEAIHARPESGWRQVRRLSRRHPLWTLSAGLLVLALLASTLLERRASRALQQQTTEQRATQAAMADMLANTGMGRWPGDETVAELMQRADVLVPHYARGDVGLEGSLWTMVGRHLTHVEVLPGQRQRARDALGRGLDMQALAFGDEDPRTLSALVDLAEFAERHGDVAQAEYLLVHFDQHAHEHFEPHDERMLAARMVAGRLHVRAGRTDEAARVLEAVLDRARRQLGDSSDLALAAAGLLVQACERRESLEQLLAALAGRLDEGASDERTVRGIVSLLGALHATEAPNTATLALERRAIAAYAENQGASAPTTRLYWNLLAADLVRAGAWNEAECLFVTSLQALRINPGWDSRQALECELQLAELYGDTRRPELAEGAYRYVLAALPTNPHGAMDLLTRATCGLARIELETERAVAASERLHHVDALRDLLYAGDEQALAVTEAALAEVLEALGREDLAAAFTQ